MFYQFQKHWSNWKSVHAEMTSSITEMFTLISKMSMKLEEFAREKVGQLIKVINRVSPL